MAGEVINVKERSRGRLELSRRCLVNFWFKVEEGMANYRQGIASNGVHMTTE